MIVGHRAAGAALVLMLVSRLSAQAPDPRNVLILHSYERDFTTQSAFATLFRAELSGNSPIPINFIEVSLQPALLNDMPRDKPVIAFLHSILAGQRPDLVVTTGGPAAVFAQTYRQELFGSAPVLYTFITMGRQADHRQAVTPVAVFREP